MSSLNKVHLIGRLGQDPELRHTTNNTAVVNLSLATSEKYKDKSGQQVENTTWHRITFWDRTAEVCAEYLSKGSLIYVEGKIETNEWQDKDGNDRTTNQICGYRMQMIDSKGDSTPNGNTGAKNENSGLDSSDDIGDMDDIDGNLPF